MLGGTVGVEERRGHGYLWVSNPGVEMTGRRLSGRRWLQWLEWMWYHIGIGTSSHGLTKVFMLSGWYSTSIGRGK